MTVRELGRLLRSGRASAVELVDEAFAKIKAGDRFNTFITLNEERARDAAIAADKELAAGIDRGPFHGIPVGYKDIIYTRGLRTTGGSLLYQDFVPGHDATVVEKLAVAGAITLGKLNLHELAYGATSKNPHFGFVLNPHDPTRMAGGSSGGSAVAVAAGFVPVALGSDTGGSIRIPASYCGVAGFKPTFGRVSRYGVMPLAYSLDTVGPIGETVEDCALAMSEISGYDWRDASMLQLKTPDFYQRPPGNLEGLRIGVPRNFYFDRVSRDVAQSVLDAVRRCERLGARPVDIELPDVAEMNTTARIVQWGESSAVYAQHRDQTKFGADVWALLEQGRVISAGEYVNAQRLRSVYRAQFDEIWQAVDVLATPATPITAPPVDQDQVSIDGHMEDARLAATRLTRAVNLLGEPALSLPCGRSADGLPIGLQLISPPHTDAWLLRVGQRIEQNL